MRKYGDTLVLAATDLSNFLGCPHRSGLDLAVAEGAQPAPRVYVDASLAALQERGQAHEHAYLAHLESQGLQVVRVSADASPDTRVSQTRDALQAGADVIYQGAFRAGGWIGYTDILRKVLNRHGTTSSLGDWHYEPYDTKLAQETRGGTILQLALYADLLADAPRYSTSVLLRGDPWRFLSLRIPIVWMTTRPISASFAPVSWHTSNAGTAPSPALTTPSLLNTAMSAGGGSGATLAVVTTSHLSLIAGVTRGQRTELTNHQAPTLTAAATLPLPLTFTPTRGSREALQRIVEQAQVQLEQRTTHAPVVRLLPVVSGDGLCRLPEPSPEDRFLDFEGARFAKPGGHEYLVGVCHTDASGALAYRSTWAWTDAEECIAFEAFMDDCVAARQANPGFHIYHYGAYEPSTLKRLAGRYATRQDILDLLLKEGRFIDLHTIVRQALRAGVESYSLKQLEQYYGFVRALPLRDASTHLRAIEAALEANAPAAATTETSRRR